MSSLPVLGLMNQQIGIRRYMKDDNTFYHEPHLIATDMFPARVEIRQSVSYGTNGAQIPSYATIYTIAEVYRDDEIIMPDGTVRKAVSVEHAVDGNGEFSHSVVSV